MIKEQVARKLHLLDAKSENITPPKWESLPEWSQNTYLEWAAEVLNLFKALLDKLTVIDYATQNKVIDEALRSHYKEDMDAQRVPSDYLLMFTECGEANAISWASSYQQLQDIKTQLLEGLE